MRQHISVAIKWLGEPASELELAGNPATAARSALYTPTSRHTLSGDTANFGIGRFYAWSSTRDTSGCHTLRKQQSFCGGFSADPCIE